MKSIVGTVILTFCLTYSFAQCNFPFSLPNDTTIDCGSSYTISAPSGLDGYIWSNNSTGTSINVNQAGTYWCTGYESLTNVIVNGDFSQGNTGFTTGYAPGSGGAWGLLSSVGEYAITTNSNLVHNNFANCTDASGTGSMLVANGSTVLGTSVWEQTVPVQANTTYLFTYKAMSVVSGSPAQLFVTINGTQIGTVNTVSSTVCNWNQYSATWTSTTAGTVNIALLNQNIAGGGNDFAVDDIEMASVCTYSDTIVVSLPPNPTITVLDDDSICLGDTAMLVANVDIPGSSVFWFHGVQNQDTVFVSPNSTSMYSAYAKSPRNCNSTTSSVLITVGDQPEIEAFGDDTLCLGDSTQIGFTTQDVLDGFYWDQNLDSLANQYVSPAATTTYVITGYNAFGCEDEDTVTVVINPIPDISLTASNTDFCKGESTTVYWTYDSSIPSTVYLNGTPTTADSLVLTPSADTGFTVRLVQYECTSAIDSLSILVKPNPTLSTVENVVTCPDEPVSLFTEADLPGTAITWLPSGVTGEFFMTTPSQDLSQYAVGDLNGCLSDSVQGEITIADTCDCVFSIPNVFTPNSDGINDAFKINVEEGKCNFKAFRMAVYNRWGTQVWESIDLNAGWDGTNNGDPVADGTYFWLLETIEQEGESEEQKGTVSLIR